MILSAAGAAAQYPPATLRHARCCVQYSAVAGDLTAWWYVRHSAAPAPAPFNACVCSSSSVHCALRTGARCATHQQLGTHHACCMQTKRRTGFLSFTYPCARGFHVNQYSTSNHVNARSQVDTWQRKSTLIRLDGLRTIVSIITKLQCFP